MPLFGRPIESITEQLSADDVEGRLQPSFDVLWNASGCPRSLNYGEDGKRLPHPR